MTRRYLFIISIILCSAVYSFAQINSEEKIFRDKTVILFKTSQYSIDPTYANNKEALKRLDSLVWKLNRQQIDTLYILSCTSPDGNIDLNKQLAEQRANSIAKYLRKKHSKANFSRIIISRKNYLWDEMTRQIKKDTVFNYKTEIENISENTSNSNQFANMLKKVDQGRCYQYIVDNYLAFFRNATAYHKNEEPKIELHSFIDSQIAKYTDATSNSLLNVPAKQSFYRWKYPFALKTNLLLDALTAVNIEMEMPITRKWSVNVGCYFPWWYLKKDKITLHLLYGYVEGRYWLGNKIRHSYYYHSLKGETNPLQGWYGGVYVGKGIYDLLWKTEGVKGDIKWSAGLSFGYVRPLNQHFALEFGTNIGYIDTDYKRFVPKGECLYWKSDESVKWFGITQAKVSLVWRLGFKQKYKP